MGGSIEDTDGVSLLVGGDVCPTLRNEDLFKTGDVGRLFGKLSTQFLRADFTIVNLECPLTAKGERCIKVGPNIKAHPNCIEGFKAADITAVNLSNNHIMDYGPEGIYSTIKAFHRAGIFTFGGGENQEQAKEMLVLERNGIRIGFIGMAESEFSIATNTSPGANPLFFRGFFRTLRNNNGRFDLLVVLLHAGAQGCPFPSPWLQDTCRFLIELGADVVICQHSHCAGCYEHYEDGFIVYGQGNLIYDTKTTMKESWREGFLVRIDISNQLEKTMTLIPFLQSNDKPGADRMSEEKERGFLETIDKLSEKILNRHQLYDMWLDFCLQNRNSYYLEMAFGSFDNRIMRALNRRTNLAEKLISKRHRLLLQNLIRCESHREAVLTLLQNPRLPNRQ